MKGLIGGRARLVATLVALVVMATASSCGGAGGGGGASANKVAKPVITPEQAAGVAMNLDREHVQALEQQNAGILTSIEVDPQLAVDENAIAKVKALGATLTEDPYTSVAALVPRQAVFPAWFIVVSTNHQDDVGLNLYGRQSSAAPWKLTVATNLEGGPIHWKQARGGWAISADLNVDPSQTLADYWNAATSGGDAASAGVAPGYMTSDIASGLNADTAQNKSDGWAVGLLFSPAGALPAGIRLDNGGVLGFAWVTELLKTRPSIAPCFPQPETNGSKWDPQVPNGTYQELSLTYTYLEGMIEPRTGNLSAISYAESTTGVTGTSCPG